MKRFPLLGSVFVGLVLPAATLWAHSGPEGWYRTAQAQIAERAAANPSAAPARNVILFVGDGMSLATVAAARILDGQLRGEPGEENYLHFERFRHTALVKTYNSNQQTPDSAGTMTAMTTGVKTFAGAIAVDQNARRGDCASQAGSERVTLLDLAQLAGLRSGIVTTTRITHATPAALYARTVDRNWETDRGMPPDAREAGCRDIALQLIDYSDKGGLGPIDVVFGGGRRAFLPGKERDPEDPDQRGHRGDGRNLIREWQERHTEGRYVWNLEGFNALSGAQPGPVFGLFESSHMQYEHDRADDVAGEPSLAEMTRKSLELLADDERGFFLMVEGGRIDHAHHYNNAWRALTDTIAFADAVRVADEMTGDDTLIIVTADHAHALTFGAYGERGNPIAGLAVQPGEGPAEDRLRRDADGIPLTVLAYTHGPGYRGGQRPDFARIDPADPDFTQEAGFNLWSGSHSGEDVPLYARGAGADLLWGVIEQNLIFHAIVEALPPLGEAAAKLAGENGLPNWQRLRDQASCTDEGQPGCFMNAHDDRAGHCSHTDFSEEVAYQAIRPTEENPVCGQGSSEGGRN